MKGIYGRLGSHEKRVLAAALIVAGCLGSCLAFGVVAVGVGTYSWREFSGLNDPWIERADVSADGRYTATMWGRSHFMDLEAKVTIECTGEPDTREVLVSWSESLPEIEWTDSRKLTITMGSRRERRSIHRTWRDVRYTIER